MEHDNSIRCIERDLRDLCDKLELEEIRKIEFDIRREMWARITEKQV